MTTISLRPSTFGGPNASRLVDVFRVFVCSTENPTAVKAVGEAFTTAEEAIAAAETLYRARVAELSGPSEGLVTPDAATRTYLVAAGTAAEWGERVEVRVRRAGAAEWVTL